MMLRLRIIVYQKEYPGTFFAADQDNIKIQISYNPNKCGFKTPLRFYF